MKLCIYQLAFIAVIICFSKALHSKHEGSAKITPDHLQLLADQISSLTEEFIEEAHKVEQLHDSTSSNVNRKARTEAGNILVRKEQQIQKTHHHLEKTKEQLESAIKLLREGNQRTTNALSGVPVNTKSKGTSRSRKHKGDTTIQFSN